MYIFVWFWKRLQCFYHAIKSHAYCISINSLLQNIDRIIPNYAKQYALAKVNQPHWNFTYRRNLIELQKWYCILDLCPMHCFILTMKVISYELNNELRLRKWVILTECIISTPIVIKTKWPKLYCNQIDSFADDFKTVHRLLRIKICFTFVDGIT